MSKHYSVGRLVKPPFLKSDSIRGKFPTIARINHRHKLNTTRTGAGSPWHPTSTVGPCSLPPKQRPLQKKLTASNRGKKVFVVEFNSSTGVGLVRLDDRNRIGELPSALYKQTNQFVNNRTGQVPRSSMVIAFEEQVYFMRIYKKKRRVKKFPEGGLKSWPIVTPIPNFCCSFVTEFL